MKKGIKHRPKPKNGPTRISPESRKLIRATLRRCHGNESEASRLLRLPVRSQLGRMLRGEMRETPAMRAAVLRARARAAKAFCWEQPDVTMADREHVRKLIGEVRWIIEVLEGLV